MNKQLLVVDDSAEVHPLIAALLKDDGIDIRPARDPKQRLILALSQKTLSGMAKKD